MPPIDDIHQSGIPKDAERDQHGNHVGQDPHSRGKSVLGAGDKGIKDVGLLFWNIFSFKKTIRDDGQDDEEQHAVAEIAGEVNFFQPFRRVM